METKLVIEIKTNFSQLINEETGEVVDKVAMKEMEKAFHKLLCDKITEFVLDEEGEQQQIIIEEFCEDNMLDRVDSYSDLGSVEIKISEQDPLMESD